MKQIDVQIEIDEGKDAKKNRRNKGKEAREKQTQGNTQICRFASSPRGGAGPRQKQQNPPPRRAVRARKRKKGRKRRFRKQKEDEKQKNETEEENGEWQKGKKIRKHKKGNQRKEDRNGTNMREVGTGAYIEARVSGRLYTTWVSTGGTHHDDDDHT